jgi:LPXTG-motif cell wall-anchored protein
MPETTRRRARPSTSPMRSSKPRTTRSRRTTTPRRRGIAGGWLQRSQPEPSGVKRAVRTVTRALPSSRPGTKKLSAAAAGGLALLAAGGLAFRKRHEASPGGDHSRAATPVGSPPPVTTDAA